MTEVQDLLESYDRKERRNMKQRLIEKHFLAKDIVQYFNADKNSKIKELWDYFPDLFAQDGPEAEKKRQELELVEYKAKMIDFALRHNHARAGGGKAGGHDT